MYRKNHFKIKFFPVKLFINNEEIITSTVFYCPNNVSVFNCDNDNILNLKKKYFVFYSLQEEEDSKFNIRYYLLTILCEGQKYYGIFRCSSNNVGEKFQNLFTFPDKLYRFSKIKKEKRIGEWYDNAKKYDYEQLKPLEYTNLESLIKNDDYVNSIKALNKTISTDIKNSYFNSFVDFFDICFKENKNRIKIEINNKKYFVYTRDDYHVYVRQNLFEIKIKQSITDEKTLLEIYKTFLRDIDNKNYIIGKYYDKIIF